MEPISLTDPAFWTKTLMQLVLLYNSLYHKNLDPNTALVLVTALEAMFHGVQGLVQSAHAIKVGMIGAQPVVPEK